MKEPFRIVIVGAGLAGLTLAARLAKGRHASRFDISVLDAGERPSFSATGDIALRVSAVANGSAEVFDSVGAWSKVLRARVSPFERMRVWDESELSGSESTLEFDAAEFAVPQLGYIVENVLLQDALLAVLDKAKVKLNFLTEVDSLPSADLVVGADGARSRVRDLVGIRTKMWRYEQTAVVTHLTPQRDHEATAMQRFLRDGPLGMLPLADGRISVVWSTTEDKAKNALSVADDELGRLLTVASDYALGELMVSGPRAAFPLCAQHSDKYVQQGVALIGDAAHAIHPLAGQGANLGVHDAVQLASVIENAIDRDLNPADLPVLRRFERARKGPNLTMLHLMTGLNHLFATDSRLVRELRTVGMRLFNNSGPVKERAVKVALGVG